MALLDPPPATVPGLCADSRVAPLADADATSDRGRLIWDGERQAFVVATLRQAMLVRGFTPETLAVAASVAHGTMYSALAGSRTRLRTARRILETLAAVEPHFRLAELG